MSIHSHEHYFENLTISKITFCRFHALTGHLLTFLISQPKHLLWVVKRVFSMSPFKHPKHIFKMMGKKIMTILRSKVLPY